VPGYIRAPERGRHWLLSTSVDQFGRRSQPQWTRIVVDAAGPEVRIALVPSPSMAPDSTAWIAPKSTLEIQARDDVSGVDHIRVLLNDSKRISSETRMELELPAEGTVEIRAAATDGVGNLSEEILKDFRIDSTPPHVDWDISGPWNHDELNPIIGPETRIRCTWTDSESGLEKTEYLKDGTKQEDGQFSGNWTAGPHVLMTRATDRTGNTNSLTCDFVADLDVPSIDGVLVSETYRSDEDILYARPPLRLEIRAIDDLSGIESLKMRRSPQDVWKSVPSILESPDGQLPEIRAVDRAGNSASFHASWILDQEGPEITIHTASGVFPTFSRDRIELTRGSAIRVENRDDGCGTATIRYRLDDGKWKEVPDLIVFGFPDTRSLEIEATDNLGNRTRQRWNVEVHPAGKDAS